MVVFVLTATTTLTPGATQDPDRVFAALADATRRDIVWRAMTGDEGVVELSTHYAMSFAAVQKHIAVLERAGLVTKERIGRRKVVRSNVDAIRAAQRVLDRYERLWRERIERMERLLEETKETEPWE
jgi:DNA-binding transcriptional ArsR family regulator